MAYNSGILSQAHEVPLRYASAPRSLSACLCCSPQRRSYYRSVFRPASTDGSDPEVRWESWHRHRFRLHDRRASCPFSGAVRRSRLPGIVSFHSQLRGLWSALSIARKGLDVFAAWRARPPAQFIGWFSAVRHIAHSRGSDYTAATPSV